MSEEWPTETRSTEEALDGMTKQDWEVIGLKATVAQQAKMIEHLRGGLGNEPQLVSYAEDMSTCTLTTGDGTGYFYDRVDADQPSSYTAVDMANSARDGFKDGVDSFKIRGNVLMEIFHDGGPEPFVCAIHGCICLEQVEAAQKDFRENMPDKLDQGEGIYTFSFYYDSGQFDDYGRCEIAPGWGFDFVSYEAFEAEEVQP